MGRDGLTSFRPSDIDHALEEAFLLIQYAFLARQDGEDSSWSESIKRAAEILEWLSQADLRPTGSPYISFPPPHTSSQVIRPWRLAN
jgi:hypothetical protein